MRKYSFIIALLLPLKVLGQSSLNYSYTTQDDFSPLTDMSDGTIIIGSGVNDGPVTSTIHPIGFEFWFMGKPYTQFSVNANGVMRLGPLGVGIAKNNDLTQDSALIAPFWTDLATDVGSVAYKTIGTKPNRVLVVQWESMQIEVNILPLGYDDGSFEARLYEGTGKIEFKYERMKYGSYPIQISASIGFTHGTADNNFLAAQCEDLSCFTSLADVEDNVGQSLYSGIFAEGAILPIQDHLVTFTPPVGPAPPSNITFSNLTSSSMQVDFISSSPSTNVAGYALYRSDDGGINYILVDTVYSAIASSFGIQSGLIPGKEYYWKIHAFSEGQLSSPVIQNATTLPSSNIIYSAGNGNWNSTTPNAPWPGGIIPTALDQVVIGNGHTITINTNAACYRLVVQNGGTLQFETTTARTMTVSDSVRIDPGGVFRSSLTGFQSGHNLNVVGHLLNDGTLDFCTSSNLAGAAIRFNGYSPSSLSGNGSVTDLRTLVIDKGNSSAFAVDISPSNLTIRGVSSGASGFVNLLNGTLHIAGNFTLGTALWASAPFQIPPTAAIWIDNPNFSTSSVNNSVICNGILKVSQGTLSVGTAINHSIRLQLNSQFILEGGTVNIAGRLHAKDFITYVQQAGTLNVATIGNSYTDSASFSLQWNSTSFTMSGGTIIIHQASGGIDYSVPITQSNLTGGTLQIGSSATASKYNFTLYGIVPNLVIDNTGHYKRVIAMDGTYSDITVNSSDTLYLNGNVRLSGSITNDGVLDGVGDLTLNGTQAQSITGTGTSTDLLVNLTINNSSITSPTITLNQPLRVLFLDLRNGSVSHSGNLTLGTTSGSGIRIFRSGGSLYSSPVFESGNAIDITYRQHTSEITTGPELPTIIRSLTMQTSNGVLLNAPLSADSLKLISGVLKTSSSNLLTITGTAVNKILTATPIEFSYISGPLTRTLPANLTTGKTYIWPVGKNAYQSFELVNPTTSSAGTMVVQIEVFDQNPGGTAGSGMTTINDRYWQTIASGSGSLTSTSVRLYENGLNQNHRIAQSTTQTGAFVSRGGQLSGNLLSATLTVDPVLGFFAIGDGATLTAGIYKVGNSWTYKTLTEVAQALRIYTLTGNVIFELQSDYNGTSPNETFPVVFTSFGTQGGNWTATIRPASSVTASVSGDPGSGNALIVLDGTKRLILDGRQGGSGSTINMTLDNLRTAATIGETVRFVNDAKYDTLKFLNIRGASTNASSGVVNFLTASVTGGTGNDSNAISNCRIYNSASGSFPAVGIYSSGTTGKTNDMNSILNSEIFDFYSTTTSTYAILLASNTGKWFIDNNKIYQTATRTFTIARSHYGFSLFGTQSVITNNVIGFSSSSGTGRYTIVGTGAALGVNYIAIDQGASRISNNRIQAFNMFCATTSGAVWTGIVNADTVSNNMFGDSSGVHGISVNGGGASILTGSKLISNNVIDSLSIVSTSSASFTGISGGGTGVEISGNIIGHRSRISSINVRMNSLTAISASSTANIHHNSIFNLRNTSTSSNRNVGISLSSSGNISDNQINDISSASNNTANEVIAGISVLGFGTKIIDHNTIYNMKSTDPSASVSLIGIKFSASGTGHTISRNLIHSITAASSAINGAKSGILISSGDVLCHNNILRLGTDYSGSSQSTASSWIGIWKSGTGNSRIFHNTVYLTGSGVGTGARDTRCYLNQSFGTIDTVINNIFVNRRSNATTGGKHYAYSVSDTTNKIFDNNIYEASGNGGTIASLDGGSTFYNSIQDIRQIFVNREQYSGVGDPLFVQPNGNAATMSFKLQSITPAESTGKILPFISTDQEGDDRNVNTPADIGADAGLYSITKAVDIFPPHFQVVPLTNSGSTVFRTIDNWLNVIDQGIGIDTSKNKRPRIWYLKNGNNRTVFDLSNTPSIDGWKWVEATNTQSPYSFVMNFNCLFGGLSIGDSIYFFVAAQDSALSPNVMFNPFFGAAGASVSAITSVPDSLYGFKIVNPFPTSVNIPGDYPTLTGTGGLFEALNGEVALTDHLNVLITSDLIEDGSHSLNQFAHSEKLVTIRPNAAALRNITGDVASGLIRLIGTDNINIDGRYQGSGRYLRFLNTNASGPTILLQNHLTNDTIRNCIIEGVTTSESNGVIFINSTTGTVGCSNLFIDSNIIRDRSDDAGIPNNLIFARGIAGAKHSAISVSNNYLFNFAATGTAASAMNITGVGIGDGWKISENKIYQKYSRPYAFKGIYVSGGENHYIFKNSIGGSDSLRGGTAMTTTANTAIPFEGIRVGASQGTVIDSNYIANIAATVSGTVYGINVQSSKNVQVNCNIVGGLSVPSDTIMSSGGIWGINLANSFFSKVTHNTVSHLSANQASAGIQLRLDTNCVVLNNHVNNMSTYSGSVNSLSGIKLEYVEFNSLIEGNVVHSLSNLNSGAVNSGIEGIYYAVLFDATANSIVKRNRIYGIKVNGTGSSPYIYGLNMFPLESHIINNQIEIVYDGTSDVRVAGIYYSGSGKPLEFMYNSIYIGGLATGNNNSAAFQKFGGGGLGLNIKNNILFNGRFGGSGQHVAISNTYSPSENWLDGGSNYNLLIAADPNKIGLWGTSTLSFSDWILQSKSDSNSWSDISANVMASRLFVDTANGNLNINFNNPEAWYANGKGLSIDTISTDFDNIPGVRSTTKGFGTDIGSDEFTPLSSPIQAAASSLPALNTTTTYKFAGREIAKVEWGSSGTLPSGLNLRYYSSVDPPQSMPRATSTQRYSNAYWDFAALGEFTAPFKIHLIYDMALLGNLPKKDSIYIAHLPPGLPQGESWIHYGNVQNNLSQNVISYGYLNKFGQFALDGFRGVPDFSLPVELSLFELTYQPKMASTTIQWRTESETQNAFFILEKRKVGQSSVEKVKTVKGQGSKSTATEYIVSDEQNTTGDSVEYRLCDVSFDGVMAYHDWKKIVIPQINHLKLHQNFPNPFNPTTRISYELPAQSKVSLKIYNILGQEVRSLYKGDIQPAGFKSVLWDGRDDHNRLCASGIYFCRLVVDNKMRIMKMTLLK